MKDKRNITFDIKEHLGIIRQNDSGWTKELNIVSWNEGPPKYDIRDWDQNHDRMGKGITLKEDEMQKLVEIYLEHKDRGK